MQAQVEAEGLGERPTGLPGRFVSSKPVPETLGTEARGLVYDLRLKDGCSNSYYFEVARFSVKVLSEIDLRAGSAIPCYSRYVQDELGEASRSLGEYCIELLTLGLTLSRYGAAAESTPEWVVGAARRLFALRHRSSLLKPPADFLRAAITRLFLARKIGRTTNVVGEEGNAVSGTSGPQLLGQLARLIEWLEATGEFEQEAKRLKNWRGFLGTLALPDGLQLIETAMELFRWFRREAEAALGGYTRGVAGFLSTEFASRGCREDQVFCGKEPVVYHLSMVAAEIMNRGLRESFDQTPRKAVLVPACMRGARASACKARVNGTDITCTACDPKCTVNRITRRTRSLGARVYIVPHSSGFSRWLERWQREPEVGVIAVACMLNILPGGYEMRARGIASQCVPLDYPGCGKHWRSKSISTDLNEERLVQVVGAAPRL